MEDQVKMNEEVDLKTKRMDTIFEKKMLQLDTSQKKMAEVSGELTLEIEELKNLRQGFIGEVRKEIEKQSNEMVARIMPSLIKGFEEKSQASVKTSLERLSRVTDTTQQIIAQAKIVMNTHKREMTLRRVWISLFFCLSSLLTAFGINYIYPTYVNYHFTSRMADSMMLGEAAREIFGELTQKQKDHLLDQYAKRIRRSLKNEENKSM